MKSELTDREKLVLWGLIEYPNLNDIELSKKLGIKRRTFNVIKTKLKNNSVFSTLIVPDFNALGCEILSIVCGSFNPLATFEVRKEGIQKIRECEEIIHTCSEDKEHFSITASKNFTELRKNAIEILRFYKQNNFLENINLVHFPLEISQYRFFEFSELIKMLFQLNVDCVKKDEKVVNSIRLTKKEKKVLYALVKMPNAKISEIAHITKIVSHTVSRIKKKLLEKGIIKVQKIPNLDVLGFELLAFMHVKYKLYKRNDYEHQATEITKISSGADSVSISLFENYTDYKDHYDRKLKYLRENNLINEDPIVLVFSLQKLKHVKDFSFAPLVKKLLEVDVGF